MPRTSPKRKASRYRRSELHKGLWDGSRLRLALPWPPSTNDYWKRRKGGGVYLSPDAKDFRAIVCGIVRRSGLREPIAGRLAMSVLLCPPELARKRDIDNHDGKAIQDALQVAKVFTDDEQIDARRSHRGQPKGDGLAYVEIRRLDTCDESDAGRLSGECEDLIAGPEAFA